MLAVSAWQIVSDASNMLHIKIPASGRVCSEVLRLLHADGRFLGKNCVFEFSACGMGAQNKCPCYR